MRAAARPVAEPPRLTRSAGGLFCTDGSAGLAHYYNWTVRVPGRSEPVCALAESSPPVQVPSGAVSGSSIISCWAAANARYCPASPALQYCEAASAPAPLCAITGTTAAPPHPPPPPPTPPAVQCASAVNVTNFTYVTGAFCTNATCPVGACQGKCNYGGLVCADGARFLCVARGLF